MINNTSDAVTARYGLDHALTAINNRVHTVGMVVLLSGFCGFFVGCSRLASWHHAVESAQVLAGIVTYPPYNSFYIYHMKIWSLFVQVCSAMLYIGLSERFVTYFFSGLLAMIGFQALSLYAFAFCRNTFLSVAAPWLIVFCLLSGGEQFGLPYLVHVGGAHWSYGSLGMSVTAVSVVLFGTGNRRAGSFLLGICPAVHVVFGLWAWMLILTCLLRDLPHEKSQLKETTTYFILGCSVCLASLTFHFMTAREVPSLPADLSATYLNAFLRYWTSHQEPVSVSSLGFWLNFVAVGMSLSWLRRFSEALPRTSLLILRAFVVAGAFGLVIAAVTWLPDNMVPAAFQRIVPGRFLNFAVFGSMAVVIGLLGSQKSLMARTMLGCLFAIVPLLYLFRAEIPLVVRGQVMIVFCALVSFMPKGPGKESDGDGKVKFWSLLRGVQYGRFRLVGVGVCVVLTVLLGPYMSNRRSADMARYDCAIDDWSNDPFYAQIRTKGGIVATSSISIMQLKTRRPVVLDYDITILGYAPESGPDLERTLKIVYGIDLFNPPKGTYTYASLDRNLYRGTWETRSLEEWIDIKSTLGVTQVVTYADWELKLPEMTRNKWYRAYAIP